MRRTRSLVPTNFLLISDEEKRKLWMNCPAEEQSRLITQVALAAYNELIMFSARGMDIEQSIETNQWLKILGLMVGREYKSSEIKLVGRYTESPARNEIVSAILQIVNENIAQAKSVKLLEISDYPIENPALMMSAITANVRKLVLRKNFTHLSEEQKTALLQQSLGSLSPSITELSLEHNRINQPKLLEFLIGEILEKSNITKIGLKDNAVGQGGIEALTRALCRNRKIMQIYLQENGIEQRLGCMAALGEMVRGNSGWLVDEASLNSPEIQRALEINKALAENYAEEVKGKIAEMNAPETRPSSSPTMPTSHPCFPPFRVEQLR